MFGRPAFKFLYSDDPGLPPPTPTPPVIAPESRGPGRVTCEGCGCSLDAKGLIIARGEGLRAFMAREDEVANLQKSLDAKDATIAQLSARIRDLEGQKKKGILW